MAESTHPQRKRPKSAAREKSTATVATATHSAVEQPSNVTLRLPDYFPNFARENRYFTHYKLREIIEAKYLDLDFFEDENFDCYAIFKSMGLV